MNSNYCQLLYTNLFECNRKYLNGKACVYIREFDETSNCDDFFNFRRERIELKHKINFNDENRYDRIMGFNETENDEMIAKQVYISSSKQHKIQLIKSLSFSNWCYFHGQMEYAIDCLKETKRKQ